MLSGTDVFPSTAITLFLAEARPGEDLDGDDEFRDRAPVEVKEEYTTSDDVGMLALLERSDCERPPYPDAVVAVNPDS